MPNSLEGIIKSTHENIEKLKVHEEEIEKLKSGHKQLAEWQKKVDEWRSASDENYKDLKLTIVNENRDTQKYFREHMKDQFELLKIATQQRYEAEKQEASNTFEIKKTEAEIKKENAKQLWALIGKLFAVGGVGSVVVLGIMNIFGIAL